MAREDELPLEQPAITRHPSEASVDGRRAIYDRYAPELVARLWRLCGSQELARDLTQDAFVIAYGRLAEFEGRSAFKTWLHGIAYNLLREHRRQHVRRRALWARFGRDHTRSLEREAWGAAEHGLIALLGAALQKLDARKRDVFVLRMIEGASVDEVAAILGIAPSTVTYRAKQAEALLRADFEGKESP